MLVTEHQTYLPFINFSILTSQPVVSMGSCNRYKSTFTVFIIITTTIIIIIVITIIIITTTTIIPVFITITLNIISIPYISSLAYIIIIIINTSRQ